MTTEPRDKTLNWRNFMGMTVQEVKVLSEKVQKLFRIKFDRMANSAPSGPAIDGFNPSFTPTTRPTVLTRKPIVPTTKNFRNVGIRIMIPF
jgi:hypothetical protein